MTYQKGDIIYVKAIVEEVTLDLRLRIPGTTQPVLLNPDYATIKDHERPKRMVKKTISRWLLLGENGQLGSFDSLDLAQDVAQDVAKRWGWPVEIIHMKGEHEVEVEEDAT